MFFAAEFLHAYTIGALAAILFFGGWQGPGAVNNQLLGVIYFMAKSFALYFVVVWIRTTLPRIRIDHMLNINWKFLTPLALAAVVVIAVADKLNPVTDTPEGTLARAGTLLLANLALALATLGLLRRVTSRMRSVAEPEMAAVMEPAPEAAAH